MRRGIFRRTACLAACLWALVAHAGPPYAGQRVQDVLAGIASRGTNVIYSTELVGPGLVVRTEPVATTDAALAREILAQHGLDLTAIEPGVFAVVRAAPRPPAPVGLPIEEIVVTASRYSLAARAVDGRSEVTHAEVHELPKLADEPLRAIQRLPGSASSGISAQAHLRGGGFDEVLVVLDGLPLYEPFHLKNFLAPVSLLDARAIESMEVSSGGFTADYGDRLSGVIDIRSLDPPEDRYSELGLSLFHASLLSAGRFGDGRGEWVAAGRRSNLDWLSGLGEHDVGRPEYYDAFGRMRWSIGEGTSLFASALTARDELSANSTDESEQVDARYRNTYVWGGWEQAWPASFTTRLTVGLTDVENERDGTIDDPGVRTGELDEVRTVRSGFTRLDGSHRSERVFTRFGVEQRELRARYAFHSALEQFPGYPYPGAPPLEVLRDIAASPDGHQFGAWLTSRVRLTDALSAEAGLRWDDQSYAEVSGSSQLSPRLNLLWDVTESSRLRLAWGRFAQAQGINELQVEDGVDTFATPERADHLIASLEQSLPRDLGLRVELYQKDYDRVRPRFENLFGPNDLLPELEPDRVRVAPARGRVRGAEVSLRRSGADPWSWWVTWAWSRAEDRIDGRDVPRSWDQTHTLNAGLRYSGERWQFSVADSYHTGWPIGVLDEEDPAVARRNADRLGHYNSLDLRAARIFALPESRLEAWFEVTGALAQRNPCCLDYELRDTPEGPVLGRETDYWPRIIPSLGVLWSF